MASNTTESLQKLSPAVQHYAWGVQGSDPSLVARMAPGDPDPSKPYAELWMGTHPTAPSTLASGETLSSFLAAHPSFSGTASAGAEWGADRLPYLFKCLSVRCPLSIQAHPDKKLAAELHKRDPKNYKDDNHKPELACAVTEFRGLCGFRPMSQIVEHLTEVPELLALVGEEAAGAVRGAAGKGGGAESEALRAAYASLMSKPDEEVKKHAAALVERLANKSSALSTAEEVVLKSNEEFPNDVGLLSVYLLNIVTLQPGESMFLKPNLPHAYLQGDCMELMAASDNVVRAGFTPKFKDVSTLTSMLDYHPALPELLTGIPEGPNVRLYAPPSEQFPEFALRRCVVAAGEEASLGTSACPRVAICVSGGGVKVSAGAGAGGVQAAEVEVGAGDVLVCAAGVYLAVGGGGGEGGTVFVASCHPCFEK